MAVVARLTGVNVLVVVIAFVTSPVLARALGPAGRGEVAAIFAVLTLAPWISELGMTAFLCRERARRTQPLGVLLGSTMPITLGSSLVGVLAAIPVAHALGRGRNEVITFIEIGLFLLPATVFMQTLYGVALGDERWRLVMLTRVLSTGIAGISIVALSLAGHLTVETAAVSYLAAGMLSGIPFLLTLRGSLPWTVDRSLAAVGLSFGVRSWLSTLASNGNTRLDQLLMAAMVSSRQLGLYALAFTLASASGALVSGVANALMPRVAVGEPALAARACRVTVMFVVVGGALVALSSSVAVPFVFGSAFNDAVPMLIVLLGASVFFVPGQLLGSALIVAGNPAAAARSQVLGLVITVPALILVLPFAGGMGAAWVSLVSYTATFVVALRAAMRLFGLPPWAFVLVTRGDVHWLRSRLRPGMR